VASIFEIHNLSEIREILINNSNRSIVGSETPILSGSDVIVIILIIFSISLVLFYLKNRKELKGFDLLVGSLIALSIPIFLSALLQLLNISLISQSDTNAISLFGYLIAIWSLVITVKISKDQNEQLQNLLLRLNSK